MLIQLCGTRTVTVSVSKAKLQQEEGFDLQNEATYEQ